jgi:hypothetical protein
MFMVVLKRDKPTLEGRALKPATSKMMVCLCTGVGEGLDFIRCTWSSLSKTELSAELQDHHACSVTKQQ